MFKLINFELKKIFTDTAAKYVFAALIIWVVFSIYTSISSFYFSIGDKENRLWFIPSSGLEAIKLVKEKMYNYETEFTAENLRQVFKDERKLLEEFEKKVKTSNWSPARINAENERMYSKMNVLYPIDELLMTKDANVYDIQDVQRADEAVPNDFYDRFFNFRAYSREGLIHQTEKDLVRKKLDRLPIPYKYKYCEGWKQITQTVDSFQELLPLFILILFMLVLKVENESGMTNIIFTTIYGRTKSAYIKIYSALIIVTAIYTIVFLIYSLGILIPFGFKGWDVQIQTGWAHESIYNLNYLQFFLFQFLLGWILSVFCLLIGLCIFSFCQNYMVSMIGAVVLIYSMRFFIMLINVRKSFIAKYISVLGINILNTFYNFLGIIYDGEFIYFFGIPVLRAYGIAIWYSIIVFVLTVLIIFNYKKMQIKN